MRVVHLTAITVAAFGLLLVANQVTAQEPPPSQFKYIEGLEPFVGFWRAEGQAENEPPITVSCRLVSNRSYLRTQVSVQTDDGRETIGTTLIGRDFAKDQVSIWEFWGDSQGHGKVEVGQGRATWNTTGVRNDGSKSTAHVVMKVDGDKLTVDITDIKHGDQPQPDMHIAMTRSQQRFGRRGGQ